jgi:hypothetical protein
VEAKVKDSEDKAKGLLSTKAKAKAINTTPSPRDNE